LTPIVSQYDTQRGFIGSFRRTDFDFFKFLGHELLVTLTAALARHERWGLIDDVLRRELYVEYGTGPQSLRFTDLWGDVQILDALSKRNARISAQADLLQARHTSGELGTALPFREFVEADVLLFLRGEFEEGGRARWFPHSAVFLEYRQPSYLVKAESHAYASELLKAFGCNTIGDVKARYQTHRPRWASIYQHAPSPPLLALNLDGFGSR
jgi:hypothetical protein